MERGCSRSAAAVRRRRCIEQPHLLLLLLLPHLPPAAPAAVAAAPAAGIELRHGLLSAAALYRSSIPQLYTAALYRSSIPQLYTAALPPQRRPQMPRSRDKPHDKTPAKKKSKQKNYSAEAPPLLYTVFCSWKSKHRAITSHARRRRAMC